MSDFYPLLARAVSNLNSGPRARQDLYDYARKFLVIQLSEQGPRAFAPDIMREQIALETAIRRVEEQLRSSQPSSSNGPKRQLADSVRVATSSTFQKRSAADHEWLDVQLDGIEGHPEISARQRAASQCEPDAKEAAFPLAVSPAKIKKDGHGKIAPRDPSNEMSSRMARPGGDLKLQATTTLKRQKKLKGSSVGDEILEAKRSMLFDPTIIGLVAIVAMLTFIVVISVPLATIYFPRLIWFSEHLIDHPIVIMAILISSCLIMLLVLPIFGIRRKTSALRSLWRLLTSIRSGGAHDAATHA
jgi:hypothetical protein